MEAILEAVKRDTRGKNAARRLRAAGQIPAVVYGAEREGDPGTSVPIALDPKPLLRILHSASGANTLITLKVDGDGASPVLLKDFLVDPVSNRLLHADFVRVNMDRRVTVTVPIVLKGEPRGVKQEGGLLDFVHREIELQTLPTQIPDAITIDVSNLGLGEGIHLRDIAKDVAWQPVTDPDQLLVHVIAPRVTGEAAAEAEGAPAAAAGAEPEVIKKGKTEKEGEAAAAPKKK